MDILVVEPWIARNIDWSVITHLHYITYQIYGSEDACNIFEYIFTGRYAQHDMEYTDQSIYTLHAICEEIYLQIKKLYRNICPSKFSSGQFFRIRNKQRKTMDFCLNLFFFFLVSKIRCGRMSKTYSVACANGMPMNDGLNVSVYISMPEPRRYSLVHTCMSGDWIHNCWLNF